MKPSLRLAVAVAAFGLASSLLHADLVVVQKVDGVPGAQVGEMTLKFKGSKMRMDLGAEVSMITDLNSSDMTTVMHSQKMYMKIDGAAMQQILKNASAAAGVKKEEKFKFEPTGRKETINGIETEVYTATNGGQKGTYWIAAKYPNGEKLMAALKQLQESALSKTARDVMPQPEDFPGVPVKTEIEMGTGQKVTTTLVSVKEEAVADAEFAPPAGYQSMQMPAMPATP